MLDRPDKLALLGAIAGFLDGEVRPQITDKGLAFRLRIAAWLLTTVAREILCEEQNDHAEIARLAALLGAEPPQPGDAAARREAVVDLQRRLVEHIRDPATDAATLAEIGDALRASLAADLAVVQPGFAPRLDVGSA